MKPLRIVHIVEALGGGLYTYFVEMFNALSERDDLEIYLIYSDQREEVEPERIKKELAQPNVILAPVSMAATISPIQDAGTVSSLSRKLKKLQPDVLHLHSSKISVLGRLAYRRSGCTAALFYTPHGYAFLRKDIPAYQRAIYKGIEFSAQKTMGGTTIACGDTEYTEAKKLGRARLIRNGITIHADRTTKSMVRDEFTVGILGRVTEARNPELFNEIARSLPHIQFIWIGGGRLRHLLTAENIEVTGWFMDREEAVGQLARLSVYLQISLWEGLPLAPLEAMSYEIPVVASDVIGNRDIVVDGETGFLCTTTGEYVAAIEKLHDTNLRKSFGLSGKKRLKELFNADKNFQELIDLYREYI